MPYDYIITKPELNEETLMHYGVLGMKWGHRKLDRQLSRIDKAYDRNKKRRTKYSSWRNEKYNKKISKAKSKGNLEKAKKYSYKKEDFNEDYNKGTKAINYGFDKQKSVINNYRKTQDAAITDKSKKKTAAYKLAKLEYANQRLIDAYGFGSKDYTALAYASDKLRGTHEWSVNRDRVMKKYKRKYGK